LKIPPEKRQSFWVFLLFAVIVAVGFFSPVSGGAWWGYVGKGGLFLIVLFVFFYTFVSSAEDLPEKVNEKEDNPPALEMLDKTPHDETPVGFGELFHSYYQEFLTVVRNAVVASGVGLYLQKGQQGLEFRAGESEFGRVERPVLIGEGSLVNNVAKQRISLLEGNLPVGTTLEGMEELEIRSFLGVPLILADEVVGVLAVGSEATENFGNEDRDFLDRCGRLLTQVMAVCHRGLRWEMDQAVYNVHLELEKTLQNVKDEESAVISFVEYIKKLFPFDRFTFCVREGNEGTIRYVYGQIDDLNQGVRFPLDEGLNGWVIKRNTPLFIPDMEEGDYVRPRYFRDENPKHGMRSFLCVPLGNEEEGAWGAISLESKSIAKYGEKGKEILMDLVIYLDSTLERIRLVEQLKQLQRGGASSQAAQFQID